MRLALVVTVVALTTGCQQDAEVPPAGAPAPGSAVVDRRPDPTAPAVLLTTADGSTVRVDVEVARTELDRRRGLMYRQHLPLQAGMLFVFDEQQVQSFWMKNTLIPLDMVFIDRELTIAGIVARAEPATTQPRSVGVPSIYVLEVNGGMMERWGVASGSKVELVNVAPAPAGAP